MRGNLKKAQDKLESLKFTFNTITIYTKTLVTLDEFVDLIKDRKLTPKKELQAIRDYNEFLKTKPQRTDFINFDDEGFYLSDNKPMFKGFITCDEASTEEKKVAMYQNTRIYVHPPNDVKGVVLYHENFATDQCTYNEIAIAYNPKNGMDRLEFT